MKANKQIELNVPQSWEDITFEQYNSLLELAIDQPEDPINTLELKVKQALVLNPKTSVEQIKSLSLPQLTKYFQAISFIDKEPVKSIYDKFEFKGKTYTLQKFNTLSLSQWIDAEKFSTSTSSHHQLIAIFYINPEEYSDSTREEVAEFLSKQPCSKVFYLSSQFFFIQKTLDLATQLYLEKIEKKLMKTERVIKNAKKIDKKIKSLQKWFGGKSCMGLPTINS